MSLLELLLLLLHEPLVAATRALQYPPPHAGHIGRT
jgi:hypothetical protein